MKILRSGETLIITETPGALWVLGTFFILVGGAFVYGALGGYSNWNEASRFAIGAHLFGGLIGVGVGSWIVYSAPATRIVVDRLGETISYNTRGILNGTARVYRFDEIDSFSLIEELDSESDPIWSLGLKLTSGEILKISKLESHSESFKRDFVFQANEFMLKQLPSYRDNEDESGAARG